MKIAKLQCYICHKYFYLKNKPDLKNIYMNDKGDLWCPSCQYGKRAMYTDFIRKFWKRSKLNKLKYKIEKLEIENKRHRYLG